MDFQSCEKELRTGLEMVRKYLNCVHLLKTPSTRNNKKSSKNASTLLSDCLCYFVFFSEIKYFRTCEGNLHNDYFQIKNEFIFTVVGVSKVAFFNL